MPKSYWNWRVVKFIYEDPEEDPTYELCEVHYTDDIPHSIGRVSCSHDSRNNLEEVVKAAFSKPTLFFNEGKLIELKEEDTSE